jgi:membrane associated rhomboid family serine protease
MIFPLKDLNPTRRTPFVTIALIAINVVVFLYELMLGRDLPGFIASFGAIPYELTHSTDLVGRYSGSPIVHTEGPAFIQLTLLTSMFMHGGFMHLVGNMLYLWIFGNNVEDVLGPLKFLGFYLLCGLAAAVAQIAIHPNSTVPTIGASGAVAGVLGAYLLAYPRARVVCLVFLIIFIQLIELPAAVVLVFWFVIQFFQGFASIAAGATGGVAWFAHVGGFLTGLLLIGSMAGPQLRALREARRWERQFGDRFPPRF